MKRPAYDLTQPGWCIAAGVGVLVVIGLACIYVTDTHYVRGHDGPANAAKQLMRVMFSALAGYLLLKIGYQGVARFAYVLFFITLALLVPLLLAKILHTSFGGLTAPRNGAYRWLHLPGFPLQPSEMLKVAYVIALAWYLRFRQNYRTFAGLMVPFLVSLLPIGMILLQPDLSTALLIVPVLLTMLFAAGSRVRHLAIIVLLGISLMPLAWGQIKGYQRARVTAVLLQSLSLRRAVIEHPERYKQLATRRQAMEWEAGAGYQLVHSKNAVGSGGLVGYGWGDGVYTQSTLLPDRHNDFVFSLIAHQWGFAGCVVVLAAFAVITVAGMRIASATPDPFGRLLAVGVTAMITVQVMINLGMTIGLLPITGMTLPFVSYGGSSLLGNFAAIALLISVSQHRPYLLAGKPFEYARREKVHPVETRGFGGEPAERTPATKGV